MKAGLDDPGLAAAEDVCLLFLKRWPPFQDLAFRIGATEKQSCDVWGFRPLVFGQKRPDLGKRVFDHEEAFGETCGGLLLECNLEGRTRGIKPLNISEHFEQVRDGFLRSHMDHEDEPVCDLAPFDARQVHVGRDPTLRGSFDVVDMPYSFDRSE